MYKVAILGCENSHADNFLKMILTEKQYDDVEFIGVYSEDSSAAEALHATYGIPVGQRPDSFVGAIDGLMITARDGAKHYALAKPYLDSGIPMFIDKPIVVFGREAQLFSDALAKHQIRVSGGSSCIYDPVVKQLAQGVKEQSYGTITGGFVRAPIYLDSEHSGMYFYAQHGIQIMTEIFGTSVLSVRASHVGNSITLVCHYADFSVTILYSDHGWSYFASVAGQDDTPGAKLTISPACFEEEFLQFYHLLQGKASKQSYDDFFVPVYIMNAMERSLASSQEEMVQYHG